MTDRLHISRVHGNHLLVVCLDVSGHGDTERSLVTMEYELVSEDGESIGSFEDAEIKALSAALEHKIESTGLSENSAHAELLDKTRGIIDEL